MKRAFLIFIILFTVQQMEAPKELFQFLAKPITLIDQRYQILNPQFSPDGTKIITISPGTSSAKIWDANTGECLLTFTKVESAQFSPDGTKIVTTYYGGKIGTVNIWDAQTGILLRALVKDASEVPSAQFSHDGTKIVTTFTDSETEIAKIWDVLSGKELLTLTGDTARVLDAQFSPDGTKIVTIPEKGTAKIWDISSLIVQEKIQKDIIASGEKIKNLKLGLQGPLNESKKTIFELLNKPTLLMGTRKK